MSRQRDDGWVHGVNCARLGKLYAIEVLNDSRLRVADLPALRAHKVYAGLSGDNRAAIVSTIRSVARGLLLEAGYKPETVARVLAENTTTQ